MRTPRALITAVTLSIGWLTLPVLSCIAQESHIDGLVGEASKGKQLYRRYCVGCHGVRGDGNGENAPWVTPQPRDFTAGLFKCRSTPAGSIPTDQDMFNTITRGYVTTNMPSWDALTRQERANLVAYIKTFSPRFREEKPAAPLPIPPEPPSSPESVRRGAELFQSMNCWSCHGKDGSGNGPSALTLTDSKGYPLKPYDLTSSTRFKCGESDRELFRDLMAGLDGTPMPSFADALKPDQVWELVHYIRTLRRASRKAVRPRAEGR
jgi:cytochrome c oxidase cbb3-type subunit 2